MNIWLHRISHCASVAYPLLGAGYLSIGFSDFGRPEFLARCPEYLARLRSGDWDYFERTFQGEWGMRPRGRYSLWRFLAEMGIGNRVIVPSQGAFSIYEVQDEMALRMSEVDITNLRSWTNEPVTLQDGLLSSGGQTVDLGYVRRVQPIAKEIPRAAFADARLTARMKTRGTTSDIGDLTGNVTRALAAFQADRPINLHTTLLEQHTQGTLDAIHAELDDAKFERLIRWYFLKVGASDVQIPAKNEKGKEGDADVVATFESLRTIIYVQAKKHEGQTDAWAVEQINDYRNKKDAAVDNADALDDGYARVAWVVSTAESFSVECTALAKESKVLLLNGKEFAKLLLNAGMEGLNTAFQ